MQRQRLLEIDVQGLGHVRDAVEQGQGVLVTPHLVREVRGHDGSLVERIEPEVRDAVRPQVAFLMNRVLSGVISN